MKQEMLPSAVIYKHILRAGFIVYCHKRQRHWMIAAPAGENTKQLLTCELPLKKGCVSRGSIDSALTAYNSSCAEMGSEARDACIRAIFEVQVTPKSI